MVIAEQLDAVRAGTRDGTEVGPIDGAGAAVRTAVVVSADAGLRKRLASSLKGLRWRVREAGGGAEAMLRLEEGACEAMLIDGWLPDLEVREFTAQVRLLFPQMDVLSLDGGLAEQEPAPKARSPRRNELLCALREALEPIATRAGDRGADAARRRRAEAYRVAPDGSVIDGSVPAGAARRDAALPELVGGSGCMREVARLVRLVAARSTTVLVEGETGTGKELVARALHRLSRRAAMPFVVLNCAAIPESLLEAELFGHVRGAFTGAVQSRMGLVERANGGTLLLDEIGEMPVSMQAKILRFLESGELQRVGENQVSRVDVRLIAATHQPLERRAAEGMFRLDLYHRLAVFPIAVPPLRERMEDVAELAEHFLARLGSEGERKRLSAGALARLGEHTWPGNVRELMHVLERGAILAGANPEIAAADIRVRAAQS